MRAGGMEPNRGRYRKRSPKPKQRKGSKGQPTQLQGSAEVVQVCMCSLDFYCVINNLAVKLLWSYREVKWLYSFCTINVSGHFELIQNTSSC